MDDQLKRGIEVEKEHSNTYMKLRKYVQEYKDLPPLDEFVKLIASDHIAEMPDYYDRLAKMEHPNE